jgi:hypothetical protein
MPFPSRFSDRIATRRPPPDYTQGAAKWRLFMYVAALMVILAVIERARDPLAWQWMWNLDQGKAPADPFDNRLKDGGLRTANDPPGTFVAAAHFEHDGTLAAAREQIQDDTVIFRPAEREIWLHEVARVQEAEADELQAESLGRVTYLQLARQPTEYRGKVVTVAGTVRLAYREPAGDNELGIMEYCVYWLRPAGGPDSPIVVYALGAPAGFPALAAGREAARRVSGELREEVEVTGVFYKRCAYLGEGGTYTAPLLIANAPSWQPRPALAGPAAKTITAAEVVTVVIAALVLAICISAVAWKRSRRRRSVDRLVSVGSLKAGPSPEDSLRELERQARGEGAA